jgi:hypothetical protein
MIVDERTGNWQQRGPSGFPVLPATISVGAGCVQICDGVHCFRRRSRAACEERTWQQDRRSDRQWLQSLHSVGLLRAKQVVGATHDRHGPAVLPLAVDYSLKMKPGSPPGNPMHCPPSTRNRYSKTRLRKRKNLRVIALTALIRRVALSV